MKGRATSCPSCGAPVEFRNRASYVTICEFCSSAVGRGDKNPEDYGKVADLVPCDSEVRRGTTGKFNDSKFEVMGHVQYRHPAGGVWDEWYLAFSGRFGWLAYSQGEYFISFQRPIKKDAAPTFESVEVGQRFSLREVEFVVTEIGTATTLGAEGEIPWPFRPNAEHKFADLDGPNKVAATFEFGDQGTTLFIGEKIPLSELHLEHDPMQMPIKAELVSAVSLNCPQCAGQIELRAPDKTERVACSHCGALLDAADGKLAFFKTVEQRDVHPYIQLGSEGVIDGMKLMAIGFMERYTQWEGRTYPWTEYLLYNAEHGFHWLIHSEKHWTFASDVSAGDVKFASDSARYDGKKFSIYDRGSAFVRYVLGEFYWKVEAGQVVTTADFIAPPHAMSVETSIRQSTETGVGSSFSEERNITVARYMQPEQVESSFGLKAGSLPRPWGVGPCQPAPETGWGIFLLWPAFLFVIFVLNSIFTDADDAIMFIAMAIVSLFPIGVMFYKHNFEVQRWADSDFSPYATDDD